MTSSIIETKHSVGHPSGNEHAQWPDLGFQTALCIQRNQGFLVPETCPGSGEETPIPA